ncbi:phage replisome organizer N-terminal domain-containing protein [Mammaliicoccus sciuri]|uniref:phage replisome organizer N-terminal domain-containing protein n=1 Tax=Mammaliicoccus sciuri TaxID=1296 RepID=UPI001E337B7D|nr:phage replisome organizer N-terminal domain-containing protein [Mammaliicoccus sciuri]MCD8800710.1 phage replisome organizer N-terminal domain-containing protein [Mammaliicoccus sciuri]
MAEITWVKLKTDMFENEKIKLIEALPDKDSILIIWIKLIAYAGKVNAGGYIMLTEQIPMNTEELATIFGRPLNTVRLAINTFERYGMIEKSEQGAIKIKNWENHQNIEGMDRVKQLNAERNRKYRQRKKQEKLSMNSNDVSVTSRDGTDRDIEVDRDIDKELDKDVEVEKKSNVNDTYTTRTTIGGQEENKNRKEEEKEVNAFDFYQSNGFGVLNSHINDEMGAFIDDFNNNGDDIVKAAMKIAIDRNNISWGYTKGILRNWINANLNSFEEVRAYEKRKLQQYQSRNNNQYQSKEKTPEWLIKQKNGETSQESSTTKTSEDFEKRKAQLEREVNSFWDEAK